jgi:hypothetical protein
LSTSRTVRRAVVTAGDRSPRFEANAFSLWSERCEEWAMTYPGDGKEIAEE